MHNSLYSSTLGAGTSGLGMLSGIINVSSVAQAIILGFVGAIGGLLAQALWKYIVKKYFKKDEKTS